MASNIPRLAQCSNVSCDPGWSYQERLCPFADGVLAMTPRVYFIFRLHRCFRIVAEFINTAVMTRGVVEIVPRTGNASITIDRFFAACRNCNSSSSFRHVQFDHHLGGTLVSLPTGILDDVEVLGLYDVIRLAGYDPVLRLLALGCSYGTNWFCYDGDVSPFPGYYFTTG